MFSIIRMVKKAHAELCSLGMSWALLVLIPVFAGLIVFSIVMLFR